MLLCIINCFFEIYFDAVHIAFILKNNFVSKCLWFAIQSNAYFENMTCSASISQTPISNCSFVFAESRWFNCWLSYCFDTNISKVFEFVRPSTPNNEGISFKTLIIVWTGMKSCFKFCCYFIRITCLNLDFKNYINWTLYLHLKFMSLCIHFM